ncbi:MAG: ATP-binding protein [Actinomycetota bacterium]|nr:ATP-binding protein [Actinomycetota bacterium]
MAGDLISAVQHTINRHRMLEKADRVLVSVSGGPDSVFLLHALARIAPEYHLGIEVFHLDHVTRGGQSKKDALFVKELCEQAGSWFYPPPAGSVKAGPRAVCIFSAGSERSQA